MTSTATGSSTTRTATAPESGVRVWRGIPVALGLVLLLTLALFWPSVWSFTNTWGRYNYAHGWLVPGLVAWLMWSGRAGFRGAGTRHSWLLIPIAGLSLFWLASTVMYIQLFHQTAFVLLMVCWALFVFGRSAAETVIMAGVLVLLSLPLWEVFLPVLRGVAAVMSGLLVKLLRIPAEIDGNLIHLQSGSLEVGDDCAGLNYLLAALVIGIVYAQVMLHSVRSRLLVVGLAAATAIVGNWVRIAAIAVVAHVTEMQGWLIANHIEFGWVVFAASLLVFFKAAHVIERRAARRAGGREPEADAPARNPSAGAWETRPGSAEKIRRGAVASAFAVVGPVLFFSISALPEDEVGGRGLEALAGGEGWHVVASAAADTLDWSPDYQGEQEHRRLAFTNGSAFVYGDRFVYRDQSQNAKLIGWPNRIARPGSVLDERVIGPVDPAGEQWIRQAVVRTPAGPVLVWYWYRVGGWSTSTAVHAKAMEIPAFLTRRRSSELIAFSAACEPDGCSKAFEALMGVMGTPRPSEDADGSGAGTPGGD